jgi:hypothetical protein
VAGEYSQRVIERANRVVARMQRRLSVVQDEFALFDIYGPDGESIDFEKFFKKADACGHQYGSAECSCELCEELRPRLMAAIQQTMSPPPEQGVQ